MKSKSEMNRALRAKRKAQGLVELRVWLPPERRDEVVNFISRFDEYSFAIPVMTFKAITFRNKGDENEK